MGLRFRKSINLGGGFRVNISKSGIGYSWGVPGYRITKTAKGATRKTYSIPGTGISYSEEHSKPKNGQTASVVHQTSPTVHENEPIENLDVTNISQLQPAEFSDLLSAIKTNLLLNRIFNIMCIGLVGLTNSNYVLSILGIIGVVGKIYTAKKKTPTIEYEMDEAATLRYQSVISSIQKLNTCKKIWHINQSQNITNKKVNAGASKNVRRKPFSIKKHLPNSFKTNVDGMRMKFNKKTIAFLPDVILIIEGCKVGAAAYKNINITQTYSRFIESESVPSDATVIDYTWQYVNKNGGPDKRYKKNKKLPICRYGEIYLTDGKNLNIELMCSDYTKSQIFSEEFLKHL